MYDIFLCFDIAEAQGPDYAYAYTIGATPPDVYSYANTARVFARHQFHSGGSEPIEAWPDYPVFGVRSRFPCTIEFACSTVFFDSLLLPGRTRV